MKNNKVLLVGVVIVVLLLLGGGFLVLSSKRPTSLPITQDEELQTIEKLSPADIGLSLVPSYGNKRVKVVVSKSEDIKSLAYDISYEADIPASELAAGEQGGQVERGFSDEVTLAGQKSSYESKEFDLGSCSKNVCRYDTGVTEIKILMKVTKMDGKVYQVEDSVKI